MKNFIARGNVLPYTAGADIASGTLLMVGDLAGVARDDIANGDTGSVRISGVAEVPKASAADAIGQGDPCYHVGGEITHTDGSGSNALAGYAYMAAGASDTTIQVILNGNPGDAL